MGFEKLNLMQNGWQILDTLYKIRANTESVTVKLYGLFDFGVNITFTFLFKNDFSK